jgi:hypothetical protein
MQARLNIWQGWLDKQHKSITGDLIFITDLILNSDARLHPKMSYGAPFIYRYGPIGYFTVDKKLGIYFAFYWGKLLVQHDESGLFHPDDRKMVKLVMLKNRLADEDFLGAFLHLLEKALVIDGEKYGKRVI